MRFMTRSLLGIFVLALTLGLLVLAGATVFKAMEEQSNRDQRRRPPQERVFAVNVDVLQVGKAQPTIAAFGEVASWRMLEIRAATGGTIVELASQFRDGGRVSAGEILVQIDPANAQTALSLAESETSEAKAELNDAETAVILAQDEVTTTTKQRDLRSQALDRQKDLLKRGAGTTSAVETAELSLSSADQSLVGRRQALAQAEARINKARIALDRRRISLDEAKRSLAETTLRAPFSGLLSDANGVTGALVAPNEILGTLIDPNALEIAFRVSNAQFSRLIDQTGELQDVTISATLSLEDIPITVTGKIDRAGARVGDGQTGRVLYASLANGSTAALRPGDFMSIEIVEPELSGVSIIPATAINSEGIMLLLGDEDRLEEAKITILRHQGDHLIVTGVQEGREYATERLPQIGAGVKVRPVRAGDIPQSTEMAERFEKPQVDTGEETLALDKDRREKLIAFVQKNSRMPDEAKARILAQLNADKVPRAMVERLENRMGG